MANLYEGTDWYNNPQDTVRQYYQTYGGREPDAEGLAWWSNNVKNNWGTGSIDQVFSDLQRDLSANQGGGGGEEEGGIEWPMDLFPKSESKSSSVSSAGLPEWGAQWVKDYLAKYAPELAGGLSKSLAELEDPVALNAAEKSNLEYMSQENLNPIISGLGSKGVLNSSTSQNAIAKVLAELGGTSYDRAMTNQQAKINDYLKGMALLSSLLGASRVSSGSAKSESTQSNAWEPYGDLMNYMALMSNV